MIRIPPTRVSACFKQVIVLIASIGIVTLVRAQSPDPCLNHPLHIRRGPVTVRVLQMILKQQFNLRTHIDSGIPLDVPIQPLGKTPSDSLLVNILDKVNLYYVYVPSFIFIKKKLKSQPPVPFSNSTAHLKIIDDSQRVISGVRVTPRSTKKTVTTDSNGTATVPISGEEERVTVAADHLSTQEVTLRKGSNNTLEMLPEYDPMTEAIHTGYENTTKIDYTGDMAQIKGTQLNCTPGTNLQASLEGRIPGMSIVQTSGITGASFGATIRGRTSILNGRDPFYIIDGVPYAAGNQSLSYIPSGSAAGSLSPFSFLELTDIENIEVLKDAAATSIYGSRGANGVILITTKRGKIEKPRINIEFSTGINEVTRRPTLMNIHQYTQMRLEALANDNIKPNIFNAPDLTIWDTTNSNDWGKWLIGQTARTYQGKASVSGGNSTTRYFGSINELQEKNVFPFQPTHDLLSMQGNLTHQSKDQKLNIQLSAMHDHDWNHQVINDPTQWQLLAPNAPRLTQGGQLVFFTKGVAFSNPLSYLLQPYQAVSQNTLADATVSYRLTHQLTISTNIGFNEMGVNELSEITIRSQPTIGNPKGSSDFEFTRYASNIIEPQLEYKKDTGKFRFTALFGSTWQNQMSKTRSLADSGVSNDAQLNQPGLAYNKPGELQQESYYYKALFAKATVKWNNTYVLDLSARRDGSSRFGPGIHYGFFWASGFAWIFWNNKLQNTIPAISLGKLRISDGITGNDQIATYNWSPNGFNPFQSIPNYTATLGPGNTWETIRKTEISMDWGFVDNRFLLTASWYLHRARNQILPDSLPASGPNVSFGNKKVVSQASGYEFNLTARNIDQPRLQWTTSFNLSLPTDKLVSFPGLAQSNYASMLVVGKSLEVVKAYRYLGVSRDSGIFQFKDLNGDGKITPADQTAVGKLAITAEGGLDNTVRIGPWRLECFIQGRKQTGTNYPATLYTNSPPGMLAPGMNTNTTTAFLDRWRHPGDKATFQKLTTDPASTAGQAISLYTASSAVLTNASFVRLRNVCISYDFPSAWLKKNHLTTVRWFLQGQNLVTLTPYRGVDPETQNPSIMPPMRTIVAGIHVEY